MKKENRIFLLIVLLVATSFAVALIKNKKSDNKNNSVTPVSDQILFYSNYCPHCDNVADYIDENNIKDKFNFTELEVADNQTNAKILYEKAQECGINRNNIGVPLFFNNGTCLTGDTDVINYLSSK